MRHRLISAGGIAAVVLVMGSAAHAAPAAHRPPRPKGLDSCLVGTWHDHAGPSSTRWNGHLVKMHYRGGDIDHIARSGVDHDNWVHAKRSVGTYQGSQLTELIRGHNLLTFKQAGKGRLHVTEDGWSNDSTNTYVYQGQHSTGILNPSGHWTDYYRCTAHKLSWLSRSGKVLSTETRRSKRL